MAAHLPLKVVSTNYDDSQTKANVLMQAHFSRSKLPLELQADQREVLLKMPRLLQACVDVISSNGWLKPALAAMELAQMATQGLWDRDSSLLQIPFFDAAIVARCEAAEEDIDSVFDIMMLEDARRDALLQLFEARLCAGERGAALELAELQRRRHVLHDARTELKRVAAQRDVTLGGGVQHHSTRCLRSLAMPRR